MSARTLLGSWLMAAALAAGCGGSGGEPKNALADGGDVEQHAIDAASARDAKVVDARQVVTPGDAEMTAALEAGSFEIADGDASFEVEIGAVTCAQSDGGQSISLNARTLDYLTQVSIECNGTAFAVGIHAATDPYASLQDRCYVEAAWNQGTYDSFGEGTVVLSRNGGAGAFAVRNVPVRGYQGNASGVQVRVSGDFKCP